ncbi:MAG: hypothetical protein Q9160_005017 [Pyrenula sp. 1 TL-2023]
MTQLPYGEVDFKEAHQTGDGRLLADTISPFGSLESTQWLVLFAQSSNFQTVSADMRYHLLQDRSTKVILPKNEGNAWVEIFVALWSTVKAILSVQNAGQQIKWLPVFKAYKELTNLLIKGYSNHGFQAWTVPCLSAAGKYLRAFAAKADQEAKSQDSMTFGDGLQDDVVGNFGKNEKLEEAAWVINRMFTICLSDRHLLGPHPHLEALFGPIARCIRSGDLAGFDAALSSGENEFVKRRIYLTLERGRDIALRNLFRKVYLAGGYEPSKDDSPPIRRTRVPVAEFAAAIRLGNRTANTEPVDIDEVECFLANLIYKVGPQPPIIDAFAKYQATVSIPEHPLIFYPHFGEALIDKRPRT